MRRSIPPTPPVHPERESSPHLFPVIPAEAAYGFAMGLATSSNAAPGGQLELGTVTYFTTIPISCNRLELVFPGGALHSCSEGSAMVPGEGQRGCRLKCGVIIPKCYADVTFTGD